MVDANLKVPALEKLIDYAASGIGAVAGPMLAPWKARREAQARLTAAKAEADSLTLITQAQAQARRFIVEPDRTASGMLQISAGGVTQRIEFQEKKRQANIAATVRDAAEELADTEVLDHEPNPDWTARFFDCVQDVSSDDMRKLWAKLLAGEVQGAGTTSLRTLDVLKNMSSRDAVMFRELCSFVIEHFVYSADEDKPHLSFGKMLLLEDAGLVNAGPMIMRNLELDQANPSHLRYQNWMLRISSEGKTNLQVPAYALTPAGRELQRLTACTPKMEYLKSFSRFLRRKNCELSAAAILEELPDGRVRHDGFSPIEPDDQTRSDPRP